ncbi:thiaminase II [Parapedobacter sp. ISTM3]|uniref:Aminopyrimidine aminohydrolase n=1 Tax=Parapedobacter luteus TaxID=623280 RepID=A0A1T5AN49_9SPHI|nr:MULTISPECIES: thiaminase II [Parapedobacter]MBK1441907.1 thiaminase II [Parapedobacter sp. ISTM3]SKB36422.1 thiaminase (transcriptional activator TenA) [Parapedobacter luteus]
MTWSEYAWVAIEPIYQSIIAMPFITELQDGTLPIEKFQFYMAQDSGYLEHFGRALALIGARAHDTDDVLAFLRFGEGAIVVEKALHESYFNDFGVAEHGMLEPACHHYVHYLKSTAALAPVEVAMAAVLPCFWIYKKVGDYIYAHQHAGDNPYQRWIDTYAGEDFAISVRQAIAICDRVAAATTDSVRERMTEAFITASRLEYRFWDSAYRLVRWQSVG